MPWARPGYPSLSLGLLQSTLNNDGLACDTLYANLILLRMLDSELDLYHCLAYAAEGDIVFSPYYFDSDETEAAELIKERTGNYWQVPQLKTTEGCVALINTATQFVDQLFTGVDWSDYDIIGFSLMFQQLVGSLSVARAIKEKYPNKVIVFGGPSCEDPMGMEMLRCFKEVDYVVSGEADGTICSFIREVREKKLRKGLIATPGVAYRSEDGGIAFSGRAPRTEKLDAVPYPAYDDYFQQLKHLDIPNIEPLLYIEGSRGCWWGQKRQCTFCGLNGKDIEFRRKSADRLVDEIIALSQRHQTVNFEASDNILDHKSYTTLIPRLIDLQKEGYDFEFFFEIKSNTSKEKLTLLKKAGVTSVQPGIESFSDNVLTLMRKGSTGIKQIQVLKFCTELSLEVNWNLIFANPNERPEDYEEMAAMLPYIFHLPPPAPGSVIPMTLQRYSAYHRRPEDHNITGIRPASFYRQVFPRSDINLNDLAYVFEFDHTNVSGDRMENARKGFFEQIQLWRSLYGKDQLTYLNGPNFVRVSDCRPQSDGQKPAKRIITLTGLQAEIFKFCDSSRHLDSITQAFADSASEEQISAFLNMLAGQRLVFRSQSDEYLSLPLHQAGH